MAFGSTGWTAACGSLEGVAQRSAETHLHRHTSLYSHVCNACRRGRDMASRRWHALSSQYSGWWQKKKNARPPTFFPLHLNHVRHRRAAWHTVGIVYIIPGEWFARKKFTHRIHIPCAI